MARGSPFRIGIVSVEMTAEEICRFFVEASAGICNGAYSGYMCREDDKGENQLRFTPVASMGGASIRTVKTLNGEFWASIEFVPYLLSFLVRAEKPFSYRGDTFVAKEAAQVAFRKRQRELAA